jgi:glycosyltransferase involved in cell wall biosynthesis
MRILINCSNLRVGGGLQVAHSFINEIRSNQLHEFLIVVSTQLNLLLKETTFPSNFKIVEYSVKPSLLSLLFNRNIVLSKFEREFKTERVFTVFGPSYWRPASRHICGFAKPQYIYTDSVFFNLLSISQRIKLAGKKILQLKVFRESSDAYITESWDVSNRLKGIVNKDVYTVTNTYNQIFDDSSLWRSNLLEDFNGFTLLTISANYPHKNLRIIPKVVSYLKMNWPDFKFRFILTISRNEITANEFENENIVYLGKIDIDKCPGLYRKANIMFLPTLLECFSASYAEAMKMQVPIATSKLPFAQSICGDAAEYFNPLSVEDIATRIYNLANNKVYQEKLIENGIEQLKKFDTAKSRAEKYLEIIKDR